MKLLRTLALIASIGLSIDFIIYYVVWLDRYGGDTESFDLASWYYFARPILINLPLAIFLMALFAKQKS
ncbi:hypothetical protein N8603_00900 [Verrucomicrobiales bacterium]|nr:hypothetical protein [Verrucomicrobiales bacterium]